MKAMQSERGGPTAEASVNNLRFRVEERSQVFSYHTLRVITDTECFGKVTTNFRPLRAVAFLMKTAAGRAKSFAAVSDGALIVFISARSSGIAPCTLMVVANALVGLVFTALMKIVLPSAVRLTTASR